jgi:hypothetical protein
MFYRGSLSVVLLNEIMKLVLSLIVSCSYTHTDVSVPSENPNRLGRSAISRTYSYVSPKSEILF